LNNRASQNKPGANQQENECSQCQKPYFERFFDNFAFFDGSTK
jgi:hypothetical protein